MNGDVEHGAPFKQAVGAFIHVVFDRRPHDRIVDEAPTNAPGDGDRVVGIGGAEIGDVEFIEPPLETHGLYLMASRNIADGDKIIADFNRGLTKIRQNGEFDRIVNRLRKQF